MVETVGRSVETFAKLVQNGVADGAGKHVAGLII